MKIFLYKFLIFRNNKIKQICFFYVKINLLNNEEILMSIFSFLCSKQFNILKYLPEAVLVIDDKGKIFYANKSALKLFETSKLQNKNINDFFIVSSDNIINDKDSSLKQILKIVTEEQNTKITDVKIVDISYKKNKKYLLTVADNTEEHLNLNRLLTESQNQKISNYTKNVLLSKMENYLTSPLHSVIGFSQAMLSGLSGELNEKQKKYLEIINSNSSELLIFIQKLVELSKIESDYYKFNYTNFDIISFISVIINEFKVKLENKDIKLNFNTEDLTNTTFYSDKNIIKNIMVNILENASEQIETGAIHVNLSNPDSEFLLSKGFEINEFIKDKSYLMVEIICKGIDGNLYNNKDFYDPYVQVDKNSKKYLMQSLLLSSSQKCINKLNGEIWYINQSSNQISFVFVIPSEKAVCEVK